MNRLLIIILIVFSLSLLAAQDLQPWQYVRHSSRDFNGNVHVRFNGSPTILNSYELNYFQNSAWHNAVLTNPEPLVYEALLPYQWGQNLKYRLSTTYDAMGQSITAANPAFMDANTFPPVTDYLAPIGTDPVGDSVSTYFPTLDLTNTYFGYNDTMLFTALANTANSFPIFNTFTSYNIYFAGLATSASALMDSTLYVMLYSFNVPGIISTGLYKLNFNLADTTFTYLRIGNIQSLVVNGKLNMACNIADLLLDPDFGSWPPMYNTLGYLAGTIRLDIDPATFLPTFTIGDFSSLAQLIFENHHYQVQQNALPVISNIDLTELNGISTLQFSYSDADRDYPLYAKVILNNLTELDFYPETLDFTQPVAMTAIVPLTGWLTAQIRVSDNNIDYTVFNISNTAVTDEVVPIAFSCRVYPNPFNPAAGELNISLTGSKQDLAEGGIYNLKGQLIKKIEPNSHIKWNGTNDKGLPVTDGIYFGRIKSGADTYISKIILIRQ